MLGTFVSRAIVAAVAVTLSACGSSTAPDAHLDSAEIEDMMDAMSALGAFSFDPTGFSRGTAYSVVTQSAVVTVTDSYPCPEGGTVNVSGSYDINENTGNFSSQVTQGYSSCKASSASGRQWTFNGDPNVLMNMNMTFNQTTGAMTMSGTQTGGIRFSSNGASGRCSINLSFSTSLNDVGEATGTVTGTVCGESVSHSL